jgi:hypothetical protein
VEQSDSNGQSNTSSNALSPNCARNETICFDFHLPEAMSLATSIGLRGVIIFMAERRRSPMSPPKNYDSNLRLTGDLGASLGSVVFFSRNDTNAVTTQDANIQIVMIPKKLYQLGSLKFSVKYQPTKPAVGPKNKGTSSTYCRFRFILSTRRRVAVTRTMKIGIKALSPLNASGMGLPNAFCFKYRSISGLVTNKATETSAAIIAVPCVSRIPTIGTMKLSEFAIQCAVLPNNRTTGITGLP